jgi:hypothetical protein
MSSGTAKILQEAGIIPEMIPVHPGTMSILFGKSDATEPVLGEIYTEGILGKNTYGEQHSYYLDLRASSNRLRCNFSQE